MFDLRELRVLTPPDLQDRLVVAGGYVTAPELACDIDLWVLSDSSTQQVYEEVLQHLRGLTRDGRWKEFEPWAGLEVHELPEEYQQGNLDSKGYRFVGRFQQVGWPKGVQMFIAPYQTPEELLRDFDLSVHQHAVSLSGERYRLNTSTPIGEEVRVTNWDTPSTTLARLEKLSRRYKFMLRENPDYATLVSLTANDQMRSAA